MQAIEHAVKVDLRSVLNAAFDDILDYWFLSVPAVASVLIGAVAIPFVIRTVDVAPLGHYKQPVSGAVFLAALIVGVLLNLSANFIIVSAWKDRELGPRALSLAALALRRSAWRCVWTYMVWFVSYVVFSAVFMALYVAFDLVPTFARSLSVSAAAYLLLGGATLYVGWRFLRFLLSAVYLDIVLARTEHSGRRALRDAVAGMRKRFWLTCLLVLVTYVPSLLPDLFSLKTDWRLHSFITCVVGGFFAVYGTLLTLYVYLTPRTAADEAPAQSAMTPALAEA